MNAAKQQLLLEQQLAARRAKKLVNIEQNNAEERELVCESQAQEGQAGGGASSVDEQASTSTLAPQGLTHLQLKDSYTCILRPHTHPSSVDEQGSTSTFRPHTLVA
jgi:hypothetical protein